MFTRILVVDDEPDALDLFKAGLQREDREVVTCESSREAHETIGKEEWDILITDLMMPEVDGFELIKEARKQPKPALCIAVTGYGTDETLRKALETDCFGYVNKPFDWNYLNLLVDKAIKSRRWSWRKTYNAGGGEPK